MKTERSYGIIPVFGHQNEQQFLLIKHLAGHWGFPKGHAEKGESSRDAACREFIEETSIDDFQFLSDTSFIEHYTMMKKGQQIDKKVYYYLAECKQNNVIIQESEIADYAWLDRVETRNRLTFDEGKILFDKITGYIDSL